jgi:hypothetical protein
LRFPILGCHASIWCCWRVEPIHGSVFNFALPSNDGILPDTQLYIYIYIYIYIIHVLVMHMCSETMFLVQMCSETGFPKAGVF